MGNVYNEEANDIIIIKQVIIEFPEVARYISHHIRNIIMELDLAIIKNDITIVKRIRDHLLSDLQKINL